MRDLVGYQFGLLAVVKRIDSDRYGNIMWQCKCDCGGITETRSWSLTSGNTASCGCRSGSASAENGRRFSTTHGHASKGAESGAYISWNGMKARCSNANHPRWKDYGGRGIVVCERWLNSFENFLADMGEKPEGLSIDRKDNDGNYESDNCRWATAKQQRANRRDTNTTPCSTMVML